MSMVEKNLKVEYLKSTNEKKAKKATNEKEVPFRRSYNIDLPIFITDGLLAQNKINGTYKDYQLKILLDKKK